MSMLLAYDGTGNVVATLDFMVVLDEKGNAIGLIDFGAHEDSGGKLRDIWNVSTAIGSATWPEQIGGRAHDFSVVLDGDKRIAALVHKQSEKRRERGKVKAGKVLLDDQGREDKVKQSGTPKHLPLIGT